jgi:steroid 5-alpha reductase family enzyme
VTLIALLFAIGTMLAMAMASAWAVVLKTGKSGWADAFWTASIGVCGCLAALVSLGGELHSGRPLIVAALVAFWSLRLASHIAGRTLSGEDDPRYAHLRKQWGGRYRSQLFVFLQIQAAAAFVLVVALIAAATNPAPLGWGDALGITVAVVAIIGEGLSDAQLTAFKTQPENRNKVCDTGLWSLSRHPNYFFEWLYWLAYLPIGLSFESYSWGWVSILAPTLMYWLLVHVSGVPLLEAHMLRTRAEAFQNYQRRVRGFWPFPRL